MEGACRVFYQGTVSEFAYRNYENDEKRIVGIHVKIRNDYQSRSFILAPTMWLLFPVVEWTVHFQMLCSSDHLKHLFRLRQKAQRNERRRRKPQKKLSRQSAFTFNFEYNRFCEFGSILINLYLIYMFANSLVHSTYHLITTGFAFKQTHNIPNK